jgi:hypothetical protein
MGKLNMRISNKSHHGHKSPLVRFRAPALV